MENTRLFVRDQEVDAQEDHFPAVPLELVEALEQMYQDKLPEIHVTDRELGELIGQVNVVKFLREMAGRRT
jgi:hypothetical protein